MQMALPTRGQGKDNRAGLGPLSDPTDFWLNNMQLLFGPIYPSADHEGWLLQLGKNCVVEISSLFSSSVEFFLATICEPLVCSL